MIKEAFRLHKVLPPINRSHGKILRDIENEHLSSREE